LFNRLFKKLITPTQAGGGRFQAKGKVGYDDVAISTLWDKTDEARIDKELAKVRAASDPFAQTNPLAEAFEEKLMRYYNDQTLPREFEPLEQSEPKHDLVVNAGLVRIAQLVTGKSTSYFTYFASGTGVAVERPSDVRLASENYRVSMIASGFVEAVGTAMKMVGKFPSFLPSALITESGAFDGGTTGFGTMFFRTLYPESSRVEHIQGRTFYSLMQSINQVSVT
jgi:hypothetical protein